MAPCEINKIIAEKLFGYRDANVNFGGGINAITPRSDPEYETLPDYSRTGAGMLALWAELERQGWTVKYGRHHYGIPYFFLYQERIGFPTVYIHSDVIDGNKPLALALGVCALLDGQERCK